MFPIKTYATLCKQLHVDACIILGSDMHLLEITMFPFYFRHILSGFTGSAGTLICTYTGDYLLYSDGRYEQELKQKKMHYHISFEKDYKHQIQWIKKQDMVHKVGLCSYQFDYKSFMHVHMLIKKANLSLVSFSLQTLIEASIKSSSKYAEYYRSTVNASDNKLCIPLPKKLIVSSSNDALSSSKTMKNTISPLQRMITFLKDLHYNAYFTTQLHEIVYLLGVRGIMNNLMFFPAVMLLSTKSYSKSKLTDTVFSKKKDTENTIVLWLPSQMRKKETIQIIQKQVSLQLKNPVNIIIKHYEDILCNFPEQITPFFSHISFIAVDPSIVPSVLFETTYINVSKYKKNIRKIQSPIKKWRSVYSSTQINALKQVLSFDTIALLESFAHIYSCLQQGVSITESKVNSYILQYKKQFPQFIQASFNTIAAVGEHSTLPHYNPNNSRKKLSKKQPLLIDCGSHYTFGTTDITRVFYFDNNPPKLLIEDYTLILKAHINLVLLQFPLQTTGKTIDTKIRNILAQYGRKFNHGIGHGVGFCSDVHDGYFTIGQKISNEVCRDSLVLSNEPGYYRIGKWGIRLENLIVSYVKDTKITFNTLTYFPFQENLIDRSFLTEEESKWLNVYQTQCKQRYMHTLSKRAKIFFDMLIHC